MLFRLSLLFVPLLLANGVPLSGKPSGSSFLDLAMNSTEVPECPKGNCCTVTEITSPYTDSAVQNVASTEISMSAPGVGATCACGAAIQEMYSPCGDLPLRGDTTYEAFILNAGVGLSLGGFEFEAGLAPGIDAVSACVVLSRCRGGTFGFAQEGVLTRQFPTPEGPLEFELTSLMLSVASDIEMETNTGLWNGNGIAISDSLSFRGQAYISGIVTIGVELGDLEAELKFSGQHLFAMDMDKAGNSLDTVMKATLGKGKLAFGDNNLPGFQYTFTGETSIEIGITEEFSFELSLESATVTMGVNMDSAYGGQYRDFTNGIYSCAFKSMSLTDIVPLIGAAFPCVDWPAYYSDKCWFVKAGNSASDIAFGFRSNMRISMFGSYFDILFAMDRYKSSFAVEMGAWVFSCSASVSLTYKMVPSASFELTCGSKSCVDAVQDALSSSIVSKLTSAAKDFFNKNLLAEALEVEEGGEVEEMLDTVVEDDLLEDMETAGWGKKIKKGVKKTTSSVSKTATNVAKQTADTTTKVVDTVVDAVNVFSVSSPYIRVSGISASGSLCGFKISMTVSTGITLCGKKYDASGKISVVWDPASLASSVLNAIPLPF